MMKGVVLLALAVALVMVAGEDGYRRRVRSRGKKDFGRRDKSYVKKSYKREEEPYVAHEDEPHTPHSNKDEQPYGKGAASSNHPRGTTVRKQLDELGEDLGKIATDITEAATLCAISDEQLKQISGFFIPKSELIVQQQKEVIIDFDAQVTALRKEVDLAKGDVSASLALAENTHAELQRQIFDYVNGSKLGDVNKLQGEQIEQLRADLKQEKTSFSTKLGELVFDLIILHTQAGNKIRRLDRFVASRRCETGFISAGANTSTAVYFQTPFRRAPNVTITLSGFSSDLNAYYQAKADGLTLKKEVTAVYPKYFVLEVQDLSKGKVQGIYTGCRWVACHNIEGTFLNLHEDSVAGNGDHPVDSS